MTSKETHQFNPKPQASRKKCIIPTLIKEQGKLKYKLGIRKLE